MTQIEELLFLKCRNKYLFVETFPVGCAAARLVTIDVACLELDRKTAVEFIAQLIQNNTVTSLSVPEGVLRRDRFADYLKNNPTLKSLALRSEYPRRMPISRNLLSAISTMTMLEELSVVTRYLDAEDIDIFAQVVAWNGTLRKLSLTWPTTPLVGQVEFCRRNLRGDQRKTVRSWLPALKNNSVLETLTVDFHDVQEADCHAFFRALMHNATLARVTVISLPRRCDLKEICGTIRECGLEQRVVIKNHYLDYITLGDIPDCPEVTTVFFCTSYGNSDFGATLSILGSCGHIRSAFFVVDNKCLKEVHSYLAAFIARAASLKELWLLLKGCSHIEANSNLSVAQSAVVEAISLNTNLNAVTLIHLDLSDHDCPLLADFAVRSPNLHHVKVNLGNKNLRFLQHLAPAVAGCYNLLQFQVPYCYGGKQEQFTVQEATRRNTSLLIRATSFVLGDMTSRCARALEFVSKHPKLLEMVADRAAVACDEAEAMIRRALHSIADMNGFLRAACVVKYRVECCARHDGQMQLEQMNEDCWLHVRKYIMVADVQEPSLQHH
ncbi:hypothetical protein V5799_028382 [Amblyomma americanum]|uniref:Nlr family card domain protein n=1 Tax=Amblyomma americanum TaxID=6943 RepID=A0AAQ4DD11_AMBAM